MLCGSQAQHMGCATSNHHFWPSDAQFARLQPLLPNKVRGVPRVDDRKVISGIVHVLRSGLMWRDAPACYGPHKTLYNRFVRWSTAGVFDRIFAALAAENEATGTVSIDATHLPRLSRYTGGTLARTAMRWWGRRRRPVAGCAIGASTRAAP